MISAIDVLKQVLAVPPARHCGFDPERPETWQCLLGWMLMCESPHLDAELREALGARGPNRPDHGDNKKWWQAYRRNLDLRLLGISAQEGVYEVSTRAYACVAVVWDDLVRGVVYALEDAAVEGVSDAGKHAHLCALGGRRGQPVISLSAVPKKDERGVPASRLGKDPWPLRNWLIDFRPHYARNMQHPWVEERLAHRDCRSLLNE